MYKWVKHIILSGFILVLCACAPYTATLHHVTLKEGPHLKITERNKELFHDGYVILERLPVSYKYIGPNYALEITTPLDSSFSRTSIYIQTLPSNITLQSLVPNRDKGDGKYRFEIGGEKFLLNNKNGLMENDLYRIPIDILDEDGEVIDQIVLYYSCNKVSKKIMIEGI